MMRWIGSRAWFGSANETRSVSACCITKRVAVNGNPSSQAVKRLDFLGTSLFRQRNHSITKKEWLLPFTRSFWVTKWVQRSTFICLKSLSLPWRRLDRWLLATLLVMIALVRFVDLRGIGMRRICWKWETLSFGASHRLLPPFCKA